jgi:predicted TIM-barrel fold metal-dependent hydrolase
MIIDCNVGFGHWPFARFAEDTPAKLDRVLAREGIDRALVSSAEAVLYEEPEECNRELERKLARFPRLVPVPVASPRVKSAAAILAKPGIRALKLIPNYHAYSLTDHRAVDLCARAAELRIPVLVQMRVEDERSHYELLKVPGVTVEEIASLAARLSGLSIVALCPYFAEAVRLAEIPDVYVDISYAETLDTLGRLCARVPAAKVLFGSHAPWLYARAAVRKLALSSIDEGERRAIGAGNAARLFGFPA